MKKRTMIIILIILVSAVAFSSWDNARVTEPVQDLRAFLSPVPDAIKYTYGNSDRTQVMWNIITITKICKGYEIELKALRAEIEDLKKQVAEISDPNNAVLSSEIKELNVADINSVPK